MARKLRVLGFDTLYWRAGSLEQAAKAAIAEGRVLLTRSHRMKESGGELRVLIVEANDPGAQIHEVLARLNLSADPGRFFSLCLLCNAELEAIGKEEAEGRVPDFIYRSYDSFHACPRCRRVYWPGSHYVRMEKFLTEEFRK